MEALHLVHSDMPLFEKTCFAREALLEKTLQCEKLIQNDSEWWEFVSALGLGDTII